MTGQPPSDPWIDAILAEASISGRFVDLKPLENAGRGHFSYVFDALDSTTGRRVVLKFLRPDLQIRRPEADAYFSREGEICERLRGHRNIVQLIAPPAVHDVVVTTANGAILPFPFRYLATERAARDFDRYLYGKRHHPPVLWRRLQIVRDVVKGVAQLHALGYCHRDLKPDNIFLFPGGDARLGDLGLCRRIDDPAPLQSSYDLPVGHKLYGPPESFCGSGNNPSLYPIADWFAVGAILFEAIAGVRLYAAIGLQSPLEVVVFFARHGPLDKFEQVVEDISGSNPIPSIQEFAPKELWAATSGDTMGVIDGLIHGLCHFDHRRRLGDQPRILHQLDIAIARAWRDEKNRSKLRAKLVVRRLIP